MATDYNLRIALSAIDDAKRKLKRLRQDEDATVTLNVRKAL